MAERCVPQGYLTHGSAASPQIGQGVYIGNLPGSSNAAPYVAANAAYSGAGTFATQAGFTVQTDTGFISTLGAQPQNVLRITGAGGVGYIQGTDIAFAVPYSGTIGVRVLPSTQAINVKNLNFVSSIAVLDPSGTGISGTVNMAQLVSTVKGNGWAQVL